MHTFLLLVIAGTRPCWLTVVDDEPSKAMSSVHRESVYTHRRKTKAIFFFAVRSKRNSQTRTNNLDSKLNLIKSCL